MAAYKDTANATGGRLRGAYFIVAVVPVGAGDTMTLTKIPKGARVTGGWIQFGAAQGATATTAIGISGTAAKYRAAAVTNGTTQFALADTIALGGGRRNHGGGNDHRDECGGRMDDHHVPRDHLVHDGLSMFTPPLADRAGRGDLCAMIDRLAKDYLTLLARGERYAAKVVERRLDQAKTSVLQALRKKGDVWLRWMDC